jgi:hypothetical protein
MSKEPKEVRVCIFEGVAWTEENKVLFRKLAEEFANDGYCIYLREDEPKEKREYSGNYSGDSYSYPPGALHLEIFKPEGLTINKVVGQGFESLDRQ